ncbi:unnamed protein product [Lampetra fluviatilis]
MRAAFAGARRHAGRCGSVLPSNPALVTLRQLHHALPAVTAARLSHITRSRRGRRGRYPFPPGTLIALASEQQFPGSEQGTSSLLLAHQR